MSHIPYVEHWLLGPLSILFYTHVYTPPSPPLHGALVFVHGYIKYIGHYDHAHSAWASHDNQQSKISAYGKTGSPDRMLDVEWAIWVTRRQFPDILLFLMGHSMGSSVVLGFIMQTQSPPDRETLLLLSGVIASSPFMHITHPLPLFIQWLLGKLCKIFPNANLSSLVQDKVGKDALKDPWVKRFGIYRGIYDMFTRGYKLMAKGYKCWPKNLPLLVLHGTEDEMGSFVNSCPATEAFFKILQAPDKTLILYPGAWHDLMSEPDGVKEKYMEDCMSWTESHMPKTAVT
ncbi:lysophospholipase [Heterobasidion irregulare TC 32-1]|uniref:Lysophospholipase n=1 Tax=Heterobasidion irregulare (strain TC 32-1) TaxID=747525 RepID=W4K115_HETIT|nr:lysophospholipase [Heterobasidion irregulare TC 32-1]ETW79528.1 lysophospholipase [Heterobasidion irregulare TC 32-1]